MSQDKKTYNLIIGIVAIIVIVLCIAVIGFIVSKPKPLVIQGQAEATEYRVSGKLPGRVEKLYFKEGATVHIGDTLVYINSPEARAKLMQASAARQGAEAQQQKAYAGARKEQIQGAYQLWQQALVQETVLKKSYERIEKLFSQKVVSAQKYDEVKAKYDAAIAQSKAAKSQYDMALAGARIEDKEAATALVKRATGGVDEVEAILSDQYLTSPANGIISNIFPNVGELIGQGAPVMTVTDLADVWFTFNVREDYLHAMKTGDKLKVIIPALNNYECEATVNYIAVRESYATWKATKETDMYDAKTFEVRAVPVKSIDGIRPGMSVIVTDFIKK